MPMESFVFCNTYVRRLIYKKMEEQVWQEHFMWIRWRKIISDSKFYMVRNQNANEKQKKKKNLRQYE
jgi:hypothetical protein